MYVLLLQIKLGHGSRKATSAGRSALARARLGSAPLSVRRRMSRWEAPTKRHRRGVSRYLFRRSSAWAGKLLSTGIGIWWKNKSLVMPTLHPNSVHTFGSGHPMLTLRPISLLRLSLLRLLDSYFWEIPFGPGNSTPYDLDYAWVKPSEIQNLSTEIGHRCSFESQQTKHNKTAQQSTVIAISRKIIIYIYIYRYISVYIYIYICIQCM